MGSARRFRIGIAASLAALFSIMAFRAAWHAQWVTAGLFLAFAVASAFMTWLRYSRNQPVPFTAAVVIALMGKKAVPPKNE